MSIQHRDQLTKILNSKVTALRIEQAKEGITERQEIAIDGELKGLNTALRLICNMK